MTNKEYLLNKLGLPRNTTDFYLMSNSLVCEEIPDGECACETELYGSTCRQCQEHWLGGTHHTAAYLAREQAMVKRTMEQEREFGWE